ncbi:AAA family ATPase [Mucilaginibacter calamicampi]|uniref:AAA family ATPase n=1 Tax=Mucilaginibacter calamicampi TaxID=1302352 RepID=A0ABW2YX39_9SPHI
MPKIITIAHQKGGVGKSTLAINLALCFRDQLSVALADTDLQGSLYHLKNEFPGLTIVSLDKLRDIRQMTHDLLIIDTPPYLSNRLSELFLHSDLILVPTKAGFFDVMAIRSTLALIREAQLQRPQLQAAIVLNMIKHRWGINKDITALLTEMGTPLLGSVIHDRVSIARSSITGGILNGGDPKAQAEIMALAEEIVALIVR